jgi:hypothetical protein
MSAETPEWQVETSYASAGKFNRFAKKHAAEYDSLFANLEKIMRLLRAGSKFGSFSVGFFRSEGDGVYRIGQTGVRSAKESRLYVYPDAPKNIMYVLAVGDKDSQQDDINEAKRTVKQIKNLTNQPEQKQ